MVNEKAAESEDKRKGMLESVAPYQDYKMRIWNNDVKPCPKCGRKIPKHWYFDKECGWNVKKK